MGAIKNHYHEQITKGQHLEISDDEYYYHLWLEGLSPEQADRLSQYPMTIEKAFTDEELEEIYGDQVESGRVVEEDTSDDLPF